MSADNSDNSGSNRNLRYQRAADKALPQPATASQPGRNEQQRQREATLRQAREDRRERSGEAKKIDDISALFGSTTKQQPEEPGGAANAPTPGDGAGRGNAPSSHDDPPRPALELTDDEREEDGVSRPKRKATVSVNDFAVEHEIEPKAIYDLAMPVVTGEEPVTIQQLKDHYLQNRDFEQKRDDFEDWQTHVQGEVIQARQQIDDVLQRVTSVVPPEVLARAFADMQHDSEARLVKARSQLREWFPEWDDAQVKARDRQRLEEVLKTYGFSRIEVGNVNDARLIKFAMDAIRKNDRYERLKAGTREKVPSKEPTSQRKARVPNATEQALDLAKTDKVGAVAMLIGSSNGHAKP